MPRSESKLERIAAALEKIADQGPKEKPSDSIEAISAGIHIFYGQRLEEIAQSGGNAFDQAKAIRNLQKLAQSTAEKLLENQ